MMRLATGRGRKSGGARDAAPRLLAGLDVGSHTICAVAGQVTEMGTLQIVGASAVPSRGIRAGAVVHLEAATDAMERALHDLENACAHPLERIAVGIGDDNIRSFNGRGVVPVLGRDRTVTSLDKQKALQAVLAMGFPSDREIVHTIPQEFVVDGQTGIRDPDGMWGTRLEAEVHIVTGLVAVVRNLQRALERIRYAADRFILSPLATARAVLHPDEERWGVAVVDLGAQTTGIAIVENEIVRDTAILGWGSDRITHDLAVGLRTPLAEAEAIKRRWGLAGGASARAVQPQIRTVDGVEPRVVAAGLITSIVGPRVEEMLEAIARQIQRCLPLNRLPGGLVLSGGGAQLAGLAPHAQRILHVPVRIGRPSGLAQPSHEPFDPSWSCAVGLLSELASEPREAAAPARVRLLRRMTGPIREFVKARLAL